MSEEDKLKRLKLENIIDKGLLDLLIKRCVLVVKLPVSVYESKGPMTFGSCKKVYKWTHQPRDELQSLMLQLIEDAVAYQPKYESNRQLAIKVLDPTRKGKDFLERRNETEEDMMRREARMSQPILDLLQKPELTEHVSGILYGPFYDKRIKKYFTVEELCEGQVDEVDEDLKNGQLMHYNKALDYITQIFYGVKAMHLLGMMHGDLKFQNILVKKQDNRVTLKLTDFSLSPVFSELEHLTRYANFGYPSVAAPELIATETVPTAKADVWSLGSLTYHVLSGKVMFPIPVEINNDDWKRMPVDQRIRLVDSVIKQQILEMGQGGINRMLDDLGNSRGDSQEELYDLMRGAMTIDLNGRYNLSKAGEALKAQF